MEVLLAEDAWDGVGIHSDRLRLQMQGSAECPLTKDVIEEGPKLTTRYFVTLSLGGSELPFLDAISATAEFGIKDQRSLLVGLAIAWPFAFSR